MSSGALSALTDHGAHVMTAAIQFADGRIDDGIVEPPSVHVGGTADKPLSPAQARQFARALIAAAGEADAMVGAPGSR